MKSKIIGESEICFECWKMILVVIGMFIDIFEE
jgi:hypothetical protein